MGLFSGRLLLAVGAAVVMHMCQCKLQCSYNCSYEFPQDNLLDATNAAACP